MLLHIVLFNFREGFNWSSQEAIDAEQSTKDHPNHIEQIKGWLCSRNVSTRTIAADFMVLGIFKNMGDIQNYLKHPNHQEGVDKWKTVADWQIIDIDMNDEATYALELMSTFKSLLVKNHNL
ncbi:Dabb family protein [Marinomonas sp. 2405UD68-3]|uniref:Dabb family protein n=1 Tax=Marinomonas sp. 2405UD68-3 TaxID=3391835 RepID=UPI0039C91697